MAETAIPSDPYGINVNDLLKAAIGSKTVTDAKGNQTVDQTNDGTSSTTGLGTSQQIGTSNVSGTQVTKDTGSIHTTNNSSTSSSSRQQSGADTSQLQDVYNKQMQGITPEMLAAIFREGSKAAPDMVLAQSNALGARGVGNTAVAQVLNQLNGNMLSTAANMNRQMLSDAGGTAGKIADLTKWLDSSSTSSTSGSSDQIRDLTSTVNNNQVTNTASLGVTSNKQDVINHSTLQQNTSDNKQTVQTQAINTDQLAGIARMAAAGVGLAALFKYATGQGFSGTLQQFKDWLAGNNVKVPDSGAPDDPNGGESGDPYNPDPTYTPDPTDMPSDPYDPDTGAPLLDFADGGVIQVNHLLKDEKSPDNSMLLAALGGGLGVNLSGASGIGSSANDANDANGEFGSDGTAVGGQNSNPGATLGNFGLQLATKMLPFPLNLMVKLALKTTRQTPPIKVDKTVPTTTTSAEGSNDATGNNPGVTGSVSVGALSVDEAATAEANADASGDGDANGEAGGGNGDGDYADGGIISDLDPDSDGDSVTKDTDKDNDAAMDEDGDGIEDSEILSALGITKASDGTTNRVLTSTALKNMLSAMGASRIAPKSNPKVLGYADGGVIVGPGSTTSDSIKAEGPAGNKIYLSNGEYVLPADVVSKLGVHNLDAMIAALHIPAEMQNGG